MQSSPEAHTIPRLGNGRGQMPHGFARVGDGS
jgi:hypothetical protein